MDFADHSPTRPAEAFLLVRSEASLLAIPVSNIAPPEEQGQEARLDLAQLCALCDKAKKRENSITLQTAAGPISLGIDAAEELVHVDNLLALPPLTTLQTSALVRGLLANPRTKPAFAIVLDGVLLGEMIARQITDELEAEQNFVADKSAGSQDDL